MGILFLKNKPNIMKSYPTIVETGEILDADIPHDLRISYNQQWFPKIIHPKKKGGNTRKQTNLENHKNNFGYCQRLCGPIINKRNADILSLFIRHLKTLDTIGKCHVRPVFSLGASHK